MKSKNEQNKLTLLQEWCVVLKQKSDWKKVRELANTTYVSSSPKTRIVLDFFVKKGSIDIDSVANSEKFQNYSGIVINVSEWKKIGNQIPKACNIYIQLESNKDNILSKLAMQSYYQTKRMAKNFEAKRNENIQIIINSPAKDNYYGFYLTLLNEMELSDPKGKDVRQKMKELDELEQAIDFFYYENRLRILVAKLNRSSFKKTHEISVYEKKWVANIPDNIKSIPQIKYYVMAYQMFLNNSDSIFQDLWENLSSETMNQKLDLSYSYVLYLYLSAYSIHRISQGSNKFHQYYIDITSFLEEKKYLLEMGCIPATKLKNIIKSGLECKDDTQYARKMLDKYKENIPKSNNSQIIEYCNALILFYEKEYDLAKNILEPLAITKKTKGNKDQVRDDYTKVGIRYLYLMILIALGDLYKADFIRKNLQEMIYNKENNISNNYIGSYKIGIQFTKKIINAPIYKRSSYLASLKNEIDSLPNFRGKKWISMIL